MAYSLLPNSNKKKGLTEMQFQELKKEIVNWAEEEDHDSDGTNRVASKVLDREYMILNATNIKDLKAKCPPTIFNIYYKAKLRGDF